MSAFILVKNLTATLPHWTKACFILTFHLILIRKCTSLSNKKLHLDPMLHFGRHCMQLKQLKQFTMWQGHVMHSPSLPQWHMHVTVPLCRASLCILIHVSVCAAVCRKWLGLRVLAAPCHHVDCVEPSLWNRWVPTSPLQLACSLVWVLTPVLIHSHAAAKHNLVVGLVWQHVHFVGLVFKALVHCFCTVATT